MPAANANWTVDMLDALPDDGQRYEIIDGVLYVTPSPVDVHQAVAFEFCRRLDDYLRPAKLAKAMMSPLDVRKPDRKRNRVQPDVLAVRLVDGKRPPYPYDLADLWLALEVESPSNPGTVVIDTLEWHPRGMPAPLVLNLPEVFESALS